MGLETRNAEVLNGIDPEYLTFLLEGFASAEDAKRASVAVRTTLHHSLETLFSLLAHYFKTLHASTDGLAGALARR